MKNLDDYFQINSTHSSSFSHDSTAGYGGPGSGSLPEEDAAHNKQVPAIHIKDLVCFPCYEGSKESKISSWRKLTKNSYETVNFESIPRWDHNWGIHCGASGILVVDIDAKAKNKHKSEKHGVSMYDIRDRFLGCDTLVVKSRSPGCFHVYYSVAQDPRCQHFTRLLHAYGFIDIMTAAAYVISPNSVVEGCRYEVVKDRPIASMPAWVFELLNKPMLAKRWAKAKAKASPSRPELTIIEQLYWKEPSKMTEAQERLLNPEHLGARLASKVLEIERLGPRTGFEEIVLIDS